MPLFRKASDYSQDPAIKSLFAAGVRVAVAFDECVKENEAVTEEAALKVVERAQEFLHLTLSLPKPLIWAIHSSDDLRLRTKLLAEGRIVNSYQEKALRVILRSIATECMNERVNRGELERRTIEFLAKVDPIESKPTFLPIYLPILECMTAEEWKKIQSEVEKNGCLSIDSWLNWRNEKENQERSASRPWNHPAVDLLP